MTAAGETSWRQRLFGADVAQEPQGRNGEGFTNTCNNLETAEGPGGHRERPAQVSSKPGALSAPGIPYWIGRMFRYSNVWSLVASGVADRNGWRPGPVQRICQPPSPASAASMGGDCAAAGPRIRLCDLTAPAEGAPALGVSRLGRSRRDWIYYILCKCCTLMSP